MALNTCHITGNFSHNQVQMCRNSKCKVASNKYYLFCVKSKFVPYICPARHFFSLISVLPTVKSHRSRMTLPITLTSDKFWLAVIVWRHALSSLSARIEKFLVVAGNLSGCIWTRCYYAAQYTKQSKGSSAQIILPTSVENYNFLLLSTETASFLMNEDPPLWHLIWLI